MNKYLAILGVWMFVAWGCDPCDDCGEPLVYDPTVKVVFINQDSLNQLTLLVNDNKDSIAALKVLKSSLTDSINTLDDSLEVLQELIEGGENGYQSTFDQLSQIYDSLDVVSDSATSYSSQLTAINKELNSTISVISGGKVQLDQVILLNNGTVLTYEDTMSSFYLPLLLGTVGEFTETNYEITIVDTVLVLDFSYHTYETVNEARVARVRARNLEVINSDTVNVNCKTDECISDETTVTVYF